MKIATLYRKEGKVILETDNDAIAQVATDSPQDVVVVHQRLSDRYSSAVRRAGRPPALAAPYGLQAERRFASEAPAHADHGRGTPEDGPDDGDCPCRTTQDQGACAAAGCGFCLSARNVQPRSIAALRQIATELRTLGFQLCRARHQLEPASPWRGTSCHDRRSQGGETMTNPIIPAELWPEWADRHCWDENGLGFFYGPPTEKAQMWLLVLKQSHIPMPDGHDWRVPVMRQPTIDRDRLLSALERAAAAETELARLRDQQQSPAIDLEQFRKAVMRFKAMAELGVDVESMPMHFMKSQEKYAADVAEADRLLALIDGQSKRSHALDAWTDEQCAEFLSVAMRHVQIKGVLTMNEIRQGQMRANAMQPSKGEEE